MQRALCKNWLKRSKTEESVPPAKEERQLGLSNPNEESASYQKCVITFPRFLETVAIQRGLQVQGSTMSCGGSICGPTLLQIHSSVQLSLLTAQFSSQLVGAFLCRWHLARNLATAFAPISTMRNEHLVARYSGTLLCHCTCLQAAHQSHLASASCTVHLR